MKALVLFLTAGFGSKTSMIWSESRILRKVYSRHPRQLRDTVRSSMLSKPEDPDPYEVFFHLYTQMSKGRHRTLNRTYSTLFYCFFYLLVVLDLAFFRQEDSKNYASAAILALRLPVLVSSLTVLGAARVTVLEGILYCLSVIGYYLSSQFSLSSDVSNKLGFTTSSTVMQKWLFGTPIGSTPWDVIQEKLQRGVVFGSFFLFLANLFVFIFVKNRFGNTTSDIVGKMWDAEKVRWTRDPGEDPEPITSTLHWRQQRRLDGVSAKMRNAPLIRTNASEVATSDSFVLRVLVRVMEADIEKILPFFNTLALVVLKYVGIVAFPTYRAKSSDEFILDSFMEISSIFALFMLYVNETRVEDTLFELLLWIAHMPQRS